MIILEEPYVSQLLIDWIEASQHAVLDNATSRKLARNHSLALVDEKTAAARLDAGERLYTNSENALTWISEHVSNLSLLRGIQIFKNKARTRETLKPLDPNLFFSTYTTQELTEIDFETMRHHMPFILKPEVGFCSMGVYTVYCEEDWNNALASIEHDRQTWNARYPESVIGVDSFLVEAFIEGTEYALDAFFDEQGHAHILNILRHDFASASDTSDRLYLTSEAIIDEVYDVLITWLNNVNALVGVSNFPVHVEVRIEETQGTPLVHAIEFNPLRFAGLGGTDISFHAYGFYSYEAFLENKLPTREQMKEASGGNVFCMSLLNPPKETPVHATFNYDAFVEHFSGMQDLVRFDYAQTGMFGFAFLKVSPEHEEEIEYLKTTDLREFIH